MSGVNRTGLTNYFCQLAAGVIPGRIGVNISGVNMDVDMASTPEDIWSFGGIYTFPADDTAPIDTMSSSDAGDTQTILVSGRDINGDEVLQPIVLDGQNKVGLTTPMWRHNFSANDSADGLLGNIYIYEDTTITNGVPDDDTKVKGYIAIGDNQTQQGIFTTARNTNILIHHFYPFIANQQNASVTPQLITREFGKSQKASVPLGLNSNGNSFIPLLFPIPILIRPRTDIIPRITSTSDNNVAVGINYSLEIIKNE